MSRTVLIVTTHPSFNRTLVRLSESIALCYPHPLGAATSRDKNINHDKQASETPFFSKMNLEQLRLQCRRGSYLIL